MAGGNSRAIGAFVEVRFPDGRILTQEHTVGGGQASGDASPLHFGLGDSPSVNLRVTWPGGTASDWTTIKSDQTLRVSPGSGHALAFEVEN